ncbi:MAG TPA: CHAD domain-containing protein [Egibacteraceae bacterium]|nr:CHAD domain-containing protein [Egibacteraceae bacterium]
MAYRLMSAERVGDGLKRIICEQIDKADRRLAAPASERAEAIWDARKRFKKVRAALRLVRGTIGESAYKAENRCFRDAGRQLSWSRDQQVLVGSLNGLRAQRALAPLAFDAARAELAAQAEAARERLERDVEVVADVRDRIAGARLRILSRGFERDDWGALSPGLKRVYSDGHTALGDALRSGDAEHMHEWRKQVKHLWYQLRILRTASPAMLTPMADQAHELAVVLGQDHDLWLLSQWIAGWQAQPSDAEVDADTPALITVVERRRAQLHDAAQPLARQVYGQKPGAFVGGIGAAWDAWRDQCRSIQR